LCVYEKFRAYRVIVVFTAQRQLNYSTAYLLCFTVFQDSNHITKYIVT